MDGNRKLTSKEFVRLVLNGQHRKEGVQDKRWRVDLSKEKYLLILSHPSSLGFSVEQYDAKNEGTPIQLDETLVGERLVKFAPGQTRAMMSFDELKAYLAQHDANLSKSAHRPSLAELYRPGVDFRKTEPFCA